VASAVTSRNLRDPQLKCPLQGHPIAGVARSDKLQLGRRCQRSSILRRSRAEPEYPPGLGPLGGPICSV
jgi:hypothetical protein